MDLEQTWPALIKAVKQGVVPALGCTEPISLAIASAVAAKYLDKSRINKIEAKVSPNLMKNGMGVTVPGTGMVGLPIAAAIGALGGNAEAGLEVLKGMTDTQIADAKAMLADNQVTVVIADTDREIYSEANIYADGDHVKVCIVDSHTNVVLIEKNGESIFNKVKTNENDNSHTNIMAQMSVAAICDFAKKVNFDDIRFILDAGLINDALSQEGLKREYGLKIGAILKEQIDTGLLSDDLLSKVMIRTSAASDARMGGATLPAMSNSGSGNQGIAATMPVVVVADYINATEEERARALLLSHTLAIYIHSKFPPLSALCAASTAAMGSAAGMAYLLAHGNEKTIEMAIHSMIGDLTGMICDGASNSCAMKVSSSVSSAFKAVVMAMSNSRVTGNEGIVCENIEQSIANLGALASQSMKATDAQIIQIMAYKAG